MNYPINKLFLRKYNRAHTRMQVISLSLITAVSVCYGVAIHYLSGYAISPVSATLMTGIGLVALYLGLDLSVGTEYYSPVMFALLFLIGYPAQLMHMVLSRESYLSAGFDSTGQFVFSASTYSTVITIACVGILGILFGQLVVKAIISILKKCTECLRFKKRIIWPFCIWLIARIRFPQPSSATIVFNGLIMAFVFGIILDSVMWTLGIGQVGLSGGGGALPFHLLGIMYYSRLFLLPTINFVLAGWSLQLKNRRLVMWAFAFILIEAVFCGIVSISRSTLIYRVVPIIFFLSLSKPLRPRHAWLMLKLFAVVFVAFSLLIPVIQSLRNLGYSTGHLSVADINFKTLFSIQSSESLFSQVSIAASFAFRRVMGICELMAVSSYPMHGMNIFWDMVTNTGYFGYIQPAIFGLQLPNEGKMSLGVSLGFFGSLFLSGSLWTVFFGAATGSGAILFAEAMFKRLGTPLLGCGIGIILTLLVWDGRDTRTIGYGIVTVILGYFLLKAISVVSSLCHISD